MEGRGVCLQIEKIRRGLLSRREGPSKKEVGRLWGGVG